MNPFMFVIKSAPLSTSHYYKKITNAIIHICVMDTNIESAKFHAFNYIKEKLWEPLIFENSIVMSKEQTLNLSSHEELLYRKALRHGISADFLVYTDRKSRSILLDLPERL